jgi:hypothetical protein
MPDDHAAEKSARGGPSPKKPSKNLRKAVNQELRNRGAHTSEVFLTEIIPALRRDVAKLIQEGNAALKNPESINSMPQDVPPEAMVCAGLNIFVQNDVRALQQTTQEALAHGDYDMYDRATTTLVAETSVMIRTTAFLLVQMQLAAQRNTGDPIDEEWFGELAAVLDGFTGCRLNRETGETFLVEAPAGAGTLH